MTTNQTPAPVSLEEAVARLRRAAEDLIIALDMGWETDPPIAAITEALAALPPPAPEQRADAGGEVERLREELEPHNAALGQFDHHPDADIDFAVEAEVLEGMAHDVRTGMAESQWPFWGRLSNALSQGKEHAWFGRPDLEAFLRNLEAVALNTPPAPVEAWVCPQCGSDESEACDGAVKSCPRHTPPTPVEATPASDGEKS